MTTTHTSQSAGAEEETSGDSSLSGGQRRFLLMLGLPALGITFAVTVVSTYAPVLLGAKSSPVVVGLVVGGEGFFGLLLPLLVGAISDRRSDTARERARALLVAGPIAVAALLLLALPGGFALIVVGAALYFAAHFAYLAPFQALYADYVPDQASGRSRSFESIWRLIGAAGALIAGGFLIEAWKPSPFLVGAVLIGATTTAFWLYLRGREDVPVDHSGRNLQELWSTSKEILADRDVRLIIIANTLWNVTLSALRAFVVLFFTIGLGRRPSFVSGVVFPLVALGMALSAPLTGKVADRWGHIKVLRLAVPIYGLGLLLPGIWQNAWVLGMVPIVAACAATVMIVPFAALMRLMPDADHGATSGLFTLSRGLGSMLGPLLAGGAIMALRGPLSATHGFAAMWFVIGGSTLASWPVLTRIGSGRRRQREG
ncbi:MAG TPA: MFS transporter [Mycobacteriales bacterium]|nr:MFS transporter [Mycobacteriales bacterium]